LTVLCVKPLVLVAAVSASLIGLASTATAAGATSSASAAPKTMAIEFAEGLGAGQNVAHAEDGIPMRSVENLEILAGEFRLGYGGTPLPVKVTGITDRNSNGIDDDGRVEVSLFGSQSCLALGSSSYKVSRGGCAVTSAAAKGLATRSARGVDAARRWRVSSENAYAAQGLGDTMSTWNIDALSVSLTELRAGVRMTGLTDRNHDNADDDGKLTFSSSAGSVCLHLSKSTRTAGTDTAGTC
jgi:hypothetical protein